MTIELDEELQIVFNRLKKKLAPNASNREALKIILKSVFEDAFESIPGVPAQIGKGQALSDESVFEDAFEIATENSPQPPQTLLTRQLSSRHIPAAKKNKITKKAGGRCAYPHCTKQIENFHHQIPFAFNRSHENIVGLCRIHHEFCHNGVIKSELNNPETWQIGLQPHKSIYDSFYLKYKMGKGVVNQNSR